MICKDCTAQKHHLCPGESWCDCQHRVQNVGILGHPDTGATTLVHDVQELDTTPPTALPPEILDAIDRAFDAGTWVRRERPQRKEEP